MKYFIYIALLLPTILFASPRNTIAEVVKIRGDITQLSPGDEMARVMGVGEKLSEDTSIVTGVNSFARIKFIDNSEISIGPESKIIISEMKQDSPAIISLLKGRIRVEVLNETAKPDENKFFIKTKTAVIGVRDSDFQAIYNPENKITSLLTYKGVVALAKVDEATFKKIEGSVSKIIERDEVTKVPEIKKTNIIKFDEVEELNKILKNKGAVLVLPGQTAFSSDKLKKASLPVKISPVQFEILYRNREYQEKSSKYFKSQSLTESNFKPSLDMANQTVPSEGLYNKRTGNFAPKSGGIIDLNTAFYIAPSKESKLDSSTGVYVSAKIGDIDADTGQYIVPKGIILDAKNGFILSRDDGDTKIGNESELLALKDDLNLSIATDTFVSGVPVEESVIFDINEKFVHDRVSFSLWSMNQNINSNKNSTDGPLLDLNSTRSMRFQIDWQMATNKRFSPLVGIGYSVVNFEEETLKGVSQDSRKLLGLSYGFQYAITNNINFYSTFGLHQEHYLDQTSSGVTNTYTLKKVVLSRLTFGANAEFFQFKKWSIGGNVAGLATFRKRINDLVINQGTGFILEVLPKYKLAEKKWLGLGANFESQSQKITGSVGVNHEVRKTLGLELKYISDF